MTLDLMLSEGQIEELVGDQNPGPEASPRSRKRRERREQRRYPKGGYVRVIEGEKIRGDDPVKYFLPMGVGSTF